VAVRLVKAREDRAQALHRRRKGGRKRGEEGRKGGMKGGKEGGDLRNA
jgi:hypothetical protein